MTAYWPELVSGELAGIAVSAVDTGVEPRVTSAMLPISRTVGATYCCLVVFMRPILRGSWNSANTLFPLREAA